MTSQDELRALGNALQEAEASEGIAARHLEIAKTLECRRPRRELRGSPWIRFTRADAVLVRALEIGATGKVNSPAIDRWLIYARDGYCEALRELIVAPGTHEWGE